MFGINAVPEPLRVVITAKPDTIVPLDQFLDMKIIHSDLTQLSPDKRVELVDLLKKIFVVDPASRISAEAAIQHPFFKKPAAV